MRFLPLSGPGVIVLSRDSLFVTPWTLVFQAVLSMGFFRQESRSGLPFPPSGDLPDRGIEPVSPALQVDSLPLSLDYARLTFSLQPG